MPDKIELTPNVSHMLIVNGICQTKGKGCLQRISQQLNDAEAAKELKLPKTQKGEQKIEEKQEKTQGIHHNLADRVLNILIAYVTIYMSVETNSDWKKKGKPLRYLHEKAIILCTLSWE